MNAPVTIAGRALGPDEPVYVIAEISANHAQRFDAAERLVRAAAEAGADTDAGAEHEGWSAAI